MTAQDNATKKEVLVPPDGGWGYMICVAAIINFIAVSSFISCYGMIFNDFFAKLGMESTDVMLLTGVNANFGMGVIYNVTCTALNDYFKKKRLVSMSVVNTITAAAAMLTPLAVEWSKAAYGFEGTIFMVTAIGATAFIGSSLLQPVAWHMKVMEVEADKFAEVKELLSKLDDDVAEERSDIKSNDSEKTVYLFSEQNGSNSKENKLMALAKRYLDWPLLKGYLATCTCFAIPMCMFAENTFVVCLAPYLYAILWVSEHKAVLAIVTLSGVSRCTINVLFPLVVSETVSPELFPLAFGLNMVIFGMSSITLGPLMGVVRDMTNDYATMFYLLTSILAAAAVGMMAEVALKRRQGQGRHQV